MGPIWEIHGWMATLHYDWMYQVYRTSGLSTHVTDWPHLKLLLALQKILVHPKVANSKIPSHGNFFVTLTHKVWVLCISIKPDQYWRDSQNTILLFVRPQQINSNIPPLSITYVATSSYIRGQTYNLSLKHLIVIANGMDLIQSNIIPYNIKQPFDFVQHFTLQHLQHFTHTTPTYA